MPAQKRSFPDAPNDHHRHAKYHHQEEEEEEEDNYKSDGSALFMYSFLLSFLLDFSIFFFSLFLLSLFRFSPRRQIRVRSLSLSRIIYTHYWRTSTFSFVPFGVAVLIQLVSFEPRRMPFLNPPDSIRNRSFACFDFRLLRAFATPSFFIRAVCFES